MKRRGQRPTRSASRTSEAHEPSGAKKVVRVPRRARPSGCSSTIVLDGFSCRRERAPASRTLVPHGTEPWLRRLSQYSCPSGHAGASDADCSPDTVSPTSCYRRRLKPAARQWDYDRSDVRGPAAGNLGRRRLSISIKACDAMQQRRTLDGCLQASAPGSAKQVKRSSRGLETGP